MEGKIGIRKKNRHMKIIGLQVVFLAAVLVAVYLFYPKIDINVSGTEVNFRSINANVIMLSENSDFSNPRYLDLEDKSNITFSLKPGTYYWKASNGYIEGLAKEFTIQSEVGMKIDVRENNSKLVNMGNVKLNVSKNKQGMMVGHIILEPSEEEDLEPLDYVGEEI